MSRLYNIRRRRFLNFLFFFYFDLGVGSGSRGSTSGRRVKQIRLLYTRLLTQFPALLDDLCPALAQRVLDNVNKWEFNAFLLDRVTGGHCLPFICTHLLYQTGLNTVYLYSPLPDRSNGTFNIYSPPVPDRFKYRLLVLTFTRQV